MDRESRGRKRSRSPPRRARSRSPFRRSRSPRRDRKHRDDKTRRRSPSLSPSRRSRRADRDNSGEIAGMIERAKGKMEYGKPEEEDDEKDEEPKEVEKPNFGLSGALVQDEKFGNVYKGITLKWSEPEDAAVPTLHWRLYVFKNGEMMEKPLHIHRQSAYLVGREDKIADIWTGHPSCSGQHAVIQYRAVKVPADPTTGKPARRVVRPYIMDLQSTNGTFLNGEKIDDSRYIELKVKDELKFGNSTRSYLLMHDKV